LEDEEKIIMQLIIHGGDARAFSMKAIQAAEKGEFTEADQLMGEARISLNKAHDLQTTIIQEEIRGKPTSTTLLMVHAQDHVMNAMTVRDLAEHLIQLREEVHLFRKHKMSQEGIA
jgi:PTS system cellobiose-specific IIA component